MIYRKSEADNKLEYIRDMVQAAQYAYGIHQEYIEFQRMASCAAKYMYTALKTNNDMIVLTPLLLEYEKLALIYVEKLLHDLQ